MFTTGYAANLGLLGALVGPDDAAVVDSAAHASLVDGARFSEGTLRAFRHNRPNSLRRTLRSWREQPDAGGVLVAVDGIYSMEGDWAPLAEIAAACADFGARLLVDEAHALGVVGPRGAGTAAATGVRPDLIMGTFSKSLASCGGFIAGPRSVIDYLKVTCRPLMFTASGVPAALAAALEAARIAQAEDWRREAVAARAEQLRAGLAQLGYRRGGPRRERHRGHPRRRQLGRRAAVEGPARPRRLHQLRHPSGGAPGHAAHLGHGHPHRGATSTGPWRASRRPGLSRAGRPLVQAPHLRPVGAHGLQLVVDAVVGGQRPRRLRTCGCGDRRPSRSTISRYSSGPKARCW